MAAAGEISPAERQELMTHLEECTSCHQAFADMKDIHATWLPERAGFEILWRDTTDPRWHVYNFTTSAGETTLMEVSTDNHFFAVRSVGKNGARSIATSVGAPRAGPDFSVTPK